MYGDNMSISETWETMQRIIIQSDRVKRILDENYILQNEIVSFVVSFLANLEPEELSMLLTLVDEFVEFKKANK